MNKKRGYIPPGVFWNIVGIAIAFFAALLIPGFIHTSHPELIAFSGWRGIAWTLFGWSLVYVYYRKVMRSLEEREDQEGPNEKT